MIMNALEIKLKRKELGLTQDQLAKLIGVSKNTVFNYEKGCVIPDSKITILNFVLKKEKGGLKDKLEANQVTSQLNEPASEYKPKQKEGAEFDNLSFEGKLKEIYGAIMSIKNDAKENKEFIRREKRLNLENFAALQEQLFQFEEELKKVKSKKLS